MDSSQVSIFEERDEISLSGLLESHDGGGLEAEIRLHITAQHEKAHGITITLWTYLEVLSNLTNETLEGELADEQLGGLLVATDFTKSDGTGAEPVGLLHTTSGSLLCKFDKINKQREQK